MRGDGLRVERVVEASDSGKLRIRQIEEVSLMVRRPLSLLLPRRVQAGTKLRLKEVSG